MVSKLLTTTEVAEQLGLTPQTVRSLTRDGSLSSVVLRAKRGRPRRYYDAGEVAALKAGGSEAAEAYRKRAARRGAKA